MTKRRGSSQNQWKKVRPLRDTALWRSGAMPTMGLERMTGFGPAIACLEGRGSWPLSYIRITKQYRQDLRNFPQFCENEKNFMRKLYALEQF